MVDLIATVYRERTENQPKKITVFFDGTRVGEFESDISAGLFIHGQVPDFKDAFDDMLSVGSDTLFTATFKRTRS